MDELIGKHPFGTSMPPQPKAERNYTAFEFHLRKRFANRWSADVSYLLSRLEGNWSGIASSDEAVGGLQPYSGRSFNLLYYSYDSKGNATYGPLGTDRPHQFKLQATYDAPWGMNFGLNQLVQSGTPWGTVMTQNNMTFFPYGRGNIGRSPTFLRTDLLAQQEFRLPSNIRLSVGLNVINLFDQDIVTSYNVNPYRDGINIPNAQFFGGFDPVAVASARGARPNAQYKLANGFETRRAMQLQAKFSF